MIILGQVLLEELVKSGSPDKKIKALWNDVGIIFFPISTQHSHAGMDGIRYSDEGGNALAVMVNAHVFEVRGHRDFSPERVQNLWKRLRDSDWNDAVDFSLGTPV